MSVKDRIDIMTEAEVRAALLGIIKKEGRRIYCTRTLITLDAMQDECENETLDTAIKEGKKWQV